MKDTSSRVKNHNSFSLFQIMSAKQSVPAETFSAPTALSTLKCFAVSPIEILYLFFVF
jgi:hypothetical protein